MSELTADQIAELKELALDDLPGLERRIAVHILSDNQKKEIFIKVVEKMEARNREVEEANFDDMVKNVTDSESLLGEILHLYLDDPVREWIMDYSKKFTETICEDLNYRRRRLFGEFPSEGFDISKIILEHLVDFEKKPPFSLPLLVVYMIHSRILDLVCEVKFQLPVRDIAERYNFSLPTIYEWMRRGHIRGKKQGRRVIIDVPSLERFLQQKGYLTTTTKSSEDN